MPTAPTSYVAIAALTGLAVGALATMAISDGADPPAGEADAAVVLDLRDDDGWRLVDLTHSLSPDSLYWPNGEPFEHERQGWEFDADGNWYAMARFSTPEHLGTHLDAPIHFSAAGWTSAQIPHERFLGPAVVVDISDRAAADIDSTLQPSDLEAWEARHGDIPESSILLVRTRWSERWPNWNAYYGSDDAFDTASLHFPGVSAEAAQAIVDRGVVGVGIDTASIDPGNDVAFSAHRVLAAANIFNLENLTGLDALPESGAILLALPIKITDGTGGPARVLGVVPSS
ncbi:MAG TPA: cyclase family protein [Acidobacteriota bacterium]|nr:cyclase family protein [Acidobacteriota bacterium]